MIIDILSDLHVDFYFKKGVTHDAVKTLYTHCLLYTSPSPRDVEEHLRCADRVRSDEASLDQLVRVALLSLIHI